MPSWGIRLHNLSKPDGLAIRPVTSNERHCRRLLGSEGNGRAGTVCAKGPGLTLALGELSRGESLNVARPGIAWLVTLYDESGAWSLQASAPVEGL